MTSCTRRLPLRATLAVGLVIIGTPLLSPLRGQPPLQLGWPPALGIGRTPIAADLDGDGMREVVLTNPGYTMWVICASGELCTGWNFQGFPALDQHVRVGDITGDGVPEIAYESGGTNQLEVVDGQGAVVAPWPVDLSVEGGWVSTGLQWLLLADLVPGAGLEIIVLNDGYSFNPHATVAAYSGTGTLLPGWPKSYPGQYCTLAADDLDGDGFAEVVIATRNATFSGDAPCYVFHGDGTLLPGWPAVPGSGAYERTMSFPIIADLDGDGSREIVGKSESRLFMMRSDGTMYRPPISVASWPYSHAVADLDGDGRKEVVIGGVDLKVLDIDAGIVATTAGGPFIEFSSGFAIADLDGDGGSEIAAFSNWPGGTTCHVFDRFLVELSGWPLTGFTSPTTYNQRPSIADLDGDGDLELVFSAAPDGTLAFDFENTSDRPLWAQWQSYRNDPTASSSVHASTGPPFLRGDGNGDGAVDIADVFGSLTWQFTGGEAPGMCRDALDANDDGRVNVADAIYTVMGLFALSPAILATECAFDTTGDMIECTSQEVCPD